MLVAAAMAAITIVPFAGILRHEFLNWDDTIAISQNPNLLAPGALRWAFTTPLLDHYQPVAWLVWIATANVTGIRPLPFHAISLIGHTLNAVLVYVLTLQLTAVTSSPHRRCAAAAAAGLVFAVHPIQTEAVAWASAFPYVLSGAFALLSTVVYVEYVRTENLRIRRALFATSCLMYIASLLSREYLLMFPAVLLCLDYWVLRRTERLSRILVEKGPFAAAAIAGGWLESKARVLPALVDLTAGQRIVLAIATPLRYVGRLLLPVSLSPVYPLPVPASVGSVEIASCVAVALGIGATLAYLRRPPALVPVVIAFLLCIAPTLIAPSGVQASADRYLYLALVPVSLAVGAVVSWALDASRVVPVFAGALVVMSAAATTRQVSFWRDSVTLWSRAVAVDERNDIATYNLAAALADAGRPGEAASWYEQTIKLVPDHASAKANLAAIQATRDDANAARLASQGQFAAAIDAYDRLLDVDPDRDHARAARGIALTRVGRWEAAVEDLILARHRGINDAEVANSLAFALVHLGRDAEAVAVLKDALRAEDDVSIAHNLAQLLLDSSDPTSRDAKLAQKLALEVCARTGNGDARALETLAAAYAANGDRRSARQTAERALLLAHSGGDARTAEALEQMIRQLGS